MSMYNCGRPTTAWRSGLVGLLSSSALVVVMAAGFGASAAAQDQAAADDEDVGIEEIVVTSRKRGNEFLQDTPSPITAFDENMLERLGVVNFEDFAYQVPGLTFNDGGPGERRYIVRGIASAGQQQVAVYYDEVPTPGVQDSSSDSASQTTDIKLYDMERIEVLKGPQGTTFGANSQTGTVRFIFNKPDLNEFESSLQGEASETRFGEENWNVFSMINLPIVEDKLGVRIVAFSGRDSGYIDNVRLGAKNWNWVETTGARGIIRMKPTENLTIDLMAIYQERDTGSDQRFHPFDSFQERSDATDIGLRDNVSAAARFQTGDLQNGDFTFNPRPDNQQIYSLTANWQTPYADVTATTSFYNRDFDFKFDSSWILFFLGVGPAGATCPSGDACVRPDLFPARTDQSQSLDQYHFELRANSNLDGPLQWLGGIFWRQRKSKFRSFVPVTDAATGETFDPGIPFLTDPFAGPTPIGSGIQDCAPCVFARIANKNIKEIALFGEATYDITDRIEVLAGLRWFRVDQTDFGLTVFPFALFPPNPSLPLQQNANQNKLIKKFEVSWKATDDALLYVLAAQGFRLGGTNNQGVVDIPALFGADDIWNYEFGAKTSWADNRVILNVSTFLIQWDNIQVAAQDPTGAFGFVTNAGKAEVVGVEAELFAKPNEHWDFTGGLSWLPRKQLTKDQATTVDIGGVMVNLFAPGLAGDEIPTIPEVTFNFTSQYNYHLQALADWDGYLRVELSHKGKSRSQLRPFESGNGNDRPLRSFELVNLRAGFTNEAFNGEIVFFVRNIFDARPDLQVAAANGQPTFKITSRPRTVGLTLRKRF